MITRRPPILVVDDEPLHLDAVLSLCEQLGFGFVGARTSADALRIAAETTLSAALVDWDLPDGGGPELARRLRGRDPASGATSVIAVLVAPGADARARALADGADDVLERPLDGAELAACLRRLELTQDVDLLDLNAVAAMRRLGLLEHLYPAFFTFLRAEVTKLEAAIAQEDRTAIRNLAHRIRGSSAQMGASLLAVLLSDIEGAVTGAGALEIPHSDARLDAVVAATIAAMKRELKTID